MEPDQAVWLLLFLLPALAGAQWQAVEDVFSATGVAVQMLGPRQKPFPRLPPKSLEATVLTDFQESFNLMQDVSPVGDNMFTDTSEQYVATIPTAYVEGEGGLVYDASGRVYHLPYFFFNRTSLLRPLPQHTLAQAAGECEHYDALASVVQKYGFMYYHFLEETLPRVALLKKAGLSPSTKLLTWGEPYEYEYLALLGIPREQVVAYDAARVYCAGELLLPTPTPRITPPREALLDVREALGVTTLPEDQRNLLIYVSRTDEPTRNVSNEKQLLGTIQAVFPGLQVEVFRGGLPPAHAISLFQRARVILGPHGAGLSHALFAAPGTALVELLFMADPPLMFWHTAAALGQEYWMVPLPQSYWMQPSFEAPVEEVVDVLRAVLPPSPSDDQPAGPAPSTCPAGSWSVGGECRVCPAGTYTYNPGTWRCRVCFHGRVAEREGSKYCRTCPPGTYADSEGQSCVACPRGTFSQLAGAWTVEQCQTPQQRRQQMEDSRVSVQQLSKLSPLFARAVRGRGLGEGSSNITQHALCAAYKAAGTFDDPYKGPYLTPTNIPAECLPSVQASPDPYALLSPVPVTPRLYPQDAWLIPIPTPSPAAPPSPAPALPPIFVPPLEPLEPLLLRPSPPVPSGGVMAPVQMDSSAGGGSGGRNVVDNFVIIILCVLGGIILLPASMLAGRWLWRHRRERQQARSRAASKLPPEREEGHA